MQESTEHPINDHQHPTEFLVGQHSLFLAGLGQSFFYLHQFKPWLPAWVAGPIFLAPWGLVFVLCYHSQTLFGPETIRAWWLRAVCATAVFTIAAESIWVLGLMPPPTTDHKIASDVLVQVFMNLGWLSIIPLLRDYRNNPEYWK